MVKGILFGVFMGICSISFAQVKGKPTSSPRGKFTFEQYCLACHQADGSGVPFLNPPLKGTKWVLGDKLELIRIVLKGMDGEIEVNGETFNNVMPSHAHLTDQEVADVLTYVRSSFGNQASPVSIEEVRQVRPTAAAAK